MHFIKNSGKSMKLSKNFYNLFSFLKNYLIKFRHINQLIYNFIIKTIN